MSVLLVLAALARGVLTKRPLVELPGSLGVLASRERPGLDVEA